MYPHIHKSEVKMLILTSGQQEETYADSRLRPFDFIQWLLVVQPSGLW